MSMSVDLRSWKEMSPERIPADVTLDVLVSDPWTGYAWVGWQDEQGAACRAPVHETQLAYVAPHKRKLLLEGT